MTRIYETTPLLVRFADKLAFMPDGCWYWTGATADTGYGTIWDNAIKKQRSAHRVSYELFVGSLPKGLHVDHLCLVRRCVNPQHLEAVTQAENNRREVEVHHAEPEHGTTARYWSARFPCRCDLCCGANAAYYLERKRRLRRVGALADRVGVVT